MAEAVSIADDPFRALLDAAVDAIVLIDARGCISGFNRSAQTLFGYGVDEVRGRNVSMLMPAPYRQEHDAYIERYAATGERRIIGIGREVMAVDKNGRRFPIDLSVGEFAAASGHGFVGIIRDISERKRQEALLRQTSEELRSVFAYAPTAMTTTDPAGHILRVNRACTELLGYSEEQLLGCHHAELMPEDIREAAQAAFAQLRRDGGEFREEFRYRRSDGSEMEALLYSALVVDGSGKPQMIVSEIVDRSALLAANREAEALRERLTHASRVGQLGEMVSGIAHEVNQPLTAIANYANACRRLLASGQAEPQDLMEPLEKIAVQAERAGQVIRGLRTLARRQDSQRVSLDLNHLVREVLPLVEFDARQAGFKLRTRLADALPPISADAVQIQQIILNLLRNAIEAMQQSRRGDSIDVVTTQPEARMVEVHVADRGPGVAAEAAAQLFEPFCTTKPEGMGLGLSICRSIASAHGGELSYYHNEFQGATFALRLPALARSGSAP